MQIVGETLFYSIKYLLKENLVQECNVGDFVLFCVSCQERRLGRGQESERKQHFLNACWLAQPWSGHSRGLGTAWLGTAWSGRTVVRAQQWSGHSLVGHSSGPGIAVVWA